MHFRPCAPDRRTTESGLARLGMIGLGMIESGMGMPVASRALLRCRPGPATVRRLHARLSMPDVAAPDRAPVSRLAQALVAAGMVATIAGLLVHGLWRELPAERFALSLLLAGLSWTAAWAMQRIVHCSTASALAVTWILALAVYVGPLPVLATALLGLAALAIGLFAVPAAWPGRAAIATVLGLAVIAGLTGWAVTLPLFHWWLWLPFLLAIVFWRRAALARALHAMRAGWRKAVGAAPSAASAVVILIGLVSTACWIPAMQLDDLAYHLNLPTQLMSYGRYAPQPEYQVWSFAPWAGDLLHGVVFVLSRREAHGALNALWLALAAGAAWSVASALGACLRERWAAVAVFASLPPLVWMAAGMQTELAATAVLLAFAAVVVSPGDGHAAEAQDVQGHVVQGHVVQGHVLQGHAVEAPAFSKHAFDRRMFVGRMLAGSVLLAGLFALKLVHGVSAVPLLAYALWRHRMPARGAVIAMATALAFFAAIASSSYAQAWFGTGNPLLPMFNHVFGSPYFPAEQFRDERWFAGVDAALPWRLTFDTDRYVEAWDGGLGFVLIAMSGAWWLALQRRGSRGFVLATTVVLCLPLLPMQYARYAYPALALCCVLLPIGLRARIGARAFVWLIAGVCTLNLAYQANASWLHHSAAIKRTIKSGGDQRQVFAQYVPERLLLRDVPNAPEHLVLATDRSRSHIAELAGRGRTVSGHDPSLASEAAVAEQDASGARWAALFARERIRWALVTSERASPAVRAGLARAGATHARTLRNIELWRLPTPASRIDTEGAP
jgi:hypothetical protein